MVTIPLPDAQLMTFNEFIDWKPDNRRFELHHGTPIEMQPTGDHVREASPQEIEIISFLNSVLVLEIHRQQRPYLLPKQALVKLPDEDTAYLPDVLLINREGLAQEPLWKKASTVILGTSVPLVIEVVSTNWRDDYGKKSVDYESLGIAEYWIVDYLGLGGRRYIGSPKRPTLSVYCLMDDEYQVSQFRGDELIQSALFPELALTATTVFRAGH